VTNPRKKHAFIGRHLGLGQVWACLLQFTSKIMAATGWWHWCMQKLYKMYLNTLNIMVYFSESVANIFV
jgi:hypothetical protein